MDQTAIIPETVRNRPSRAPHRLLLRKTAAQVEHESSSQNLRRKLGPVHLVMLGIGATIGAGVYVMTGSAAAMYAGPAVVMSFLIASFACVFVGLCYAELASVMPVAGSAYTYAYTVIGELGAWTVGWLMLLEYGVSGAAVATGLAGYGASLLKDFGIVVPAFWITPTIQAEPTAHGIHLIIGQGIDIPAALAIAVAAAILIRGISESATVTAVIVVIKVSVLLLFVAYGISWVDTALWHPFVPPNEGGFRFGVSGIFRAASVLFFAYCGFEAVSTASAEARTPRRDVPIGIIGALVVCTLLYVIVALVLTGLVSYRDLNVADPLAIAVNAMHRPGLALIVKIGAVCGLCSVLLVMAYGQTRIFYTISRDGLIPKLFSDLHPRFATPWKGTLLLGGCMMVLAALLPIDILSDLVSIGTTLAFAIVCLSVIWHRNAMPDAHRPFRVPFGGVRVRGLWIGTVPVIGLVMCGVMLAPLIADMIGNLFHGNPVPFCLLAGYAVLGVGMYLLYGLRHSRLAAEQRRLG